MLGQERTRHRLARRVATGALVMVGLVVPATVAVAAPAGDEEQPSGSAAAASVSAAPSDTTVDDPTGGDPAVTEDPDAATTSTSTVPDGGADDATTDGSEPAPTDVGTTEPEVEPSTPETTEPEPETTEPAPEAGPDESTPAEDEDVEAASVEAAAVDCRVSRSVAPGSGGGSAHRCVEQRLAELGYAVRGPNKYFDPVSMRSIRSFMASKGVPWRGVVSPLALQRLGIWGGPSLAGSCGVRSTVAPGTGGSAGHRCVELRLAQLGYDVRGPNPYFDSRSMSSIRSFMASNGVPWRGVVSPLALAKLRVWSGPSIGGNCSVSTSVWLGKRGTARRCVEKRLAQLGYDVRGPNTVPDRATARSARSFMASKGVPWRGAVSPLALQRLRIWDGPALVSRCRVFRTVDAGFRGRDALCVERRLARLGYPIVKIDRVLGRASANQLRRFQAANGLFVDGIAGRQTLTALRIWTPPPPPPLPANSGTGRRVVYSKSHMRIWTVEANGRVSKTHAVSGNSGYNLPTPGTHYVFSKSSYTCAYGNSNVCWRYMVRFAKGPGGGNIGFHEIPTNLATGARLQSDSQLGQALSAGCVRQSTSDAIYMWHWAPIGTKVVVLP